ncbi:hypothetical protein G4G27_17590 [Sphingomonas sp. So64.6b]|uniref:hypothetical protein n=1 Tax=Sphingomonas sp. So64.6b TaxID=2997354 RepID=UPI001603AF55|nr:hypothetical protein [Sphingomonas sp. So64.6b]QNA85593.1 hypothetical protein G4G27_17590 [Sphingomonas sp. So64.6b]
MRMPCIVVATLLGLGMAANGMFMLAAPLDWYFAVPGVTSTGAFNQHFIRDIGIIFVMTGGAYMVGAFRTDLRLLLWAMATIWYSGHALFHLWEIAVGICSPSAFPRDFPAVTLPALLGIGLTAWSYAESRRRRRAA